MNFKNMLKWRRLFNERRTEVQDELRNRRPNIITENLTNKINKYTLSVIYEIFFSYAAVKEELYKLVFKNTYRTPEEKSLWMFLECYN